MSAQAMGWVWNHSPYRGAVLLVHLAIADVISDLHEDQCWMSVPRLAKKARISRSTCQDALRQLEADGYVVIVDPCATEQWKPATYRFIFRDSTPSGERPPSPNQRAGGPDEGASPLAQPAGDPRPESGPPSPAERAQSQVVSQVVSQKERTRAVSRNPEPASGSGPTDPFETFWAAYPNHTKKKDARRAWEKLGPAPPLPAILAALAWQTVLPKWTDDGGRFVPHPATYLNAEQWKDEPPRRKPTLDDLYAEIDRERAAAKEAAAAQTERARDANGEWL